MSNRALLTWLSSSYAARGEDADDNGVPVVPVATVFQPAMPPGMATHTHTYIQTARTVCLKNGEWRAEVSSPFGDRVVGDAFSIAARPRRHSGSGDAGILRAMASSRSSGNLGTAAALLDPNPSRESGSLSTVADGIRALVVSRDGRWLVAGDRHGTVQSVPLTFTLYPFFDADVGGGCTAAVCCVQARSRLRRRCRWSRLPWSRSTLLRGVPRQVRPMVFTHPCPRPFAHVSRGGRGRHLASCGKRARRACACGTPDRAPGGPCTCHVGRCDGPVWP
jgi:hypothetical protein